MLAMDSFFKYINHTIKFIILYNGYRILCKKTSEKFNQILFLFCVFFKFFYWTSSMNPICLLVFSIARDLKDGIVCHDLNNEITICKITSHIITRVLNRQNDRENRWLWFLITFKIFFKYFSSFKNFVLEFSQLKLSGGRKFPQYLIKRFVDCLDSSIWNSKVFIYQANNWKKILVMRRWFYFDGRLKKIFSFIQFLRLINPSQFI